MRSFWKMNLIFKIYYCTDHPNNASEFRKPGTGMFLQASKDYGLPIKMHYDW